MRVAHITPSGSVTEVDSGLTHGMSTDNAIATPEVTVFYDPTSSEAYNWQATRLVRDRLMAEDRICGSVIVTGPLDGDGKPTELGQHIFDALEERHAARG